MHTRLFPMSVCGIMMVVAAGCGDSPTHGDAGAAHAVADSGTAPDPGGTPQTATASMIKLSQYDRAAYCDLAAADGSLHAVFTDRPEHGRPLFLYYRSSRDGGKTWSAPVNVSDDETGDDVGYARAILDRSGRLYAIWKYVRQGELIDGPGGNANGRLVYRCLDGGEWSRRIPLGDDNVASYSFFAANDRAGDVHVVWSQMARDAAQVQMASVWHANLVRQARLDGDKPGTPQDLIVPKPLLTREEQDKMKAAGTYPAYEDTQPRKNGMINLRGYIDDRGVAHFVAEDFGITEGDRQTGKRIVLWDGAKLLPLHEYERSQTYNNFENPPSLVLDGGGRQHLIRAAEKAEKPCVRDYEITDGRLGDPVDVIVPTKGPGTLANWQVHVLPGGRIAVTAALSEKGGWRPDDLELYISFSDGDGKWTTPVCVTENEARRTAFRRETVGGSAVASLAEYSPRFASVAIDKAGGTCLLMVNSEDTIIGLTSVGVTGAGQAVSVTGTGRVDNPMVFFRRM